MLSGYAFLDRLGDEYVDEMKKQHRLSEVETADCWQCGAQYRLFAGPDLPKDDAEAKSDIKDLKERLLHVMSKDCPKNVEKGQPKGPPHVSSYRLGSNGVVGT